MVLAEESPFVDVTLLKGGMLNEGIDVNLGGSEVVDAVDGVAKDGKLVGLGAESTDDGNDGVVPKENRLGLGVKDGASDTLVSSSFAFSVPKNEGVLMGFGKESLTFDAATGVGKAGAGNGLTAGLDPNAAVGKAGVELVPEEGVAPVEEVMEDDAACLLFSSANFASRKRFSASASACCFCQRVEGALRPPLLLPNGTGEGELNEVRARSGPRWDVRANGLTSAALSLGDTWAESGISQKLEDARA